MKHFVYILRSQILNRYYCEETKDVDERLRVHNKRGNKYTTKGIPWELIKKFEVSSRSEARMLERKIKKRGVERYLNDIK